MRQLVIFTEEPSAKIVIESLCMRVLPAEKPRTVIAFSGWRNLQQKFPALMREKPNADFIVTRDNDNAPIGEIEQKLSLLVPEICKSRTYVCIIYQELESWYLGDLPALKAIFMLNSTQSKDLSVSNPDILSRPKEKLKQVLPHFKTIETAQKIIPYLSLENNSSPSFNLLLSSLKGFASC